MSVQRGARPRHVRRSPYDGDEVVGFATPRNIPGVAGPPAQRPRRSSTRRTPAVGWGTTSTPAAWPRNRRRDRPADAGLRRRRDRHGGRRSTGAIEVSQRSITSGSSWTSDAEPGAAGRRHPGSGRRPERRRTRTRWTSWWRRARPTRRRVNNHRMTRGRSAMGLPRRARIVCLARVDGQPAAFCFGICPRAHRRRCGFHRRRPAVPRSRAGPAGQAARAPPGGRAGHAACW